MTMQTPMPWIERRLSTYRWLGFLTWLALDLPRLVPHPSLPYQQWTCLPLTRLRQTAEAVGPWLLLVLAERQQRALGWEEEAGAPLFAADLTMQPYRSRDLAARTSSLLWRLEGELCRLLRLVEAPERLVPRDGEWSAEVRQRALGIALLRLGQVYAVLAERLTPEGAADHLRATGARVRQWATTADAAA